MMLCAPHVQEAASGLSGRRAGQHADGVGDSIFAWFPRIGQEENFGVRGRKFWQSSSVIEAFEVFLFKNHKGLLQRVPHE